MHRQPTAAFPAKSFVLFFAGAVVLRLGSVATWAFFPGDGLGVRLSRIIIPGLFSMGLVWLNQGLLRRDGWAPDALGLRATSARVGWFFAGAGAIAVILSLLLGALWLQVPFRFAPGSLPASDLGWKFAEYLAGNFGEELLFRAYLLLTLARHWGVSRAVLASSLLFGLFHLPGLTGLVALKMVCTTFLGGCLYAYGFLLTRTLWTALSLHAVGNLLLHHVSGMSGQRSHWNPVFDAPWPGSYDPAFAAWILVLAPLVAAAIWIHRASPEATCTGLLAPRRTAGRRSPG